MSVEKNQVIISNYALPVVGALLVAALIGAALAGWLEHGPQMLLTLGEQALAWCF